MCCFSSGVNTSPSHEIIRPQSFWELDAPRCKRDLVIKKIAVTVIALLNFAALGVAMYFIISHTSLPTNALLISPFLVGIIAALPFVNFPTMGVTPNNYSNPASILGRVLAFVFFGPLNYVSSRVDWMPYHDPYFANKVSDDLKKLPFDELSEKYGKHFFFSNLFRYGFIYRGYEKPCEDLYDQYKLIKRDIDFWTENGPEKTSQLESAKESMEKVKKLWEGLRNNFKYPFPTPYMPPLDHSSLLTRVKLTLRSYCCFGSPIDALGKLQA